MITICKERANLLREAMALMFHLSSHLFPLISQFASDVRIIDTW